MTEKTKMTKSELKQELFMRLVPNPQTDKPELVKAGHELYNRIIKELDKIGEHNND